MKGTLEKGKIMKLKGCKLEGRATFMKRYKGRAVQRTRWSKGSISKGREVSREVTL